jgi:ribosome-associated protein
MSEPVVVTLRDESIRLGQFLKLADLVDTGADAKGLLAQGLVRVNGDIETRRGRQLVAGDVVECVGRRVVVSTGSTEG